jgi:hypothetical protein
MMAVRGEEARTQLVRMAGATHLGKNVGLILGFGEGVKPVQQLSGDWQYHRPFPLHHSPIAGNMLEISHLKCKIV